MGEKVVDLKLINSMARDAPSMNFNKPTPQLQNPLLSKSPPFGSHHLRSGSKPTLMELFSRSVLKQD